eukprot:7459478-Pyramimonas_sp.AAC.1
MSHLGPAAFTTASSTSGEGAREGRGAPARAAKPRRPTGRRRRRRRGRRDDRTLGPWNRGLSVGLPRL